MVFSTNNIFTNAEQFNGGLCVQSKSCFCVVYYIFGHNLRKQTVICIELLYRVSLCLRYFTSETVKNQTFPSINISPLP